MGFGLEPSWGEGLGNKEGSQELLEVRNDTSESQELEVKPEKRFEVTGVGLTEGGGT